MTIYDLILASQSPRRRELLKLGGWTFSVAAPNVDERLLPAEHPADYVRRLAEKKARALPPTEALILAADTAVADGAHILGKPADEQEAASMLRQLSGRSHQVYTGIALRYDERILSAVRQTSVILRTFNPDEIEDYIRSGDPMDKAGAYAIQNRQFQPVAAFEGCLANVMGLPLCDAARLLRQAGLPPRHDVASRCQAYFNISCPFYEQILSEE